MFENSLRIREKYVNKIKSKVDSLMESVSLLEKVDRQLMNDQVQMGGARLNKLMKSYNNLQTGGASNIDFKAIQEAALKKKAEINAQTESIKQLNANIEKLSVAFEPINKVLGNVKQLIESISVDIPELKEGAVPSIADWNPLAQYNLYHNMKWNEIVKVNDLTDSNGEIDFNVFNKKPSENGATKGGDADRNQIKDHLVKQLGPENVTNIEKMYNDALKEIHSSSSNVSRRRSSSTSSLPGAKILNETETKTKYSFF
jgi:hypothetical protein